jgi:hypothetical protein
MSMSYVFYCPGFIGDCLSVWRASDSCIGVLECLTQVPLLIIIFWLITLPLGTFWPINS